MNKNCKELHCEVKLMGKGNPESADAVFARKPQIFIADTISEQMKNQIDSQKIHYLELKGSYLEIIAKFTQILTNLNVI